jgi:hypothetical protein
MSIRATLPAGISEQNTLSSASASTTHLRSPRKDRVRFELPEDSGITSNKLYAKEVALDNLLAFERGSKLLVEAQEHPSVPVQWWMDDGNLNEQLV